MNNPGVPQENPLPVSAMIRPNVRRKIAIRAGIIFAIFILFIMLGPDRYGPGIHAVSLYNNIISHNWPPVRAFVIMWGIVVPFIFIPIEGLLFKMKFDKPALSIDANGVRWHKVMSIVPWGSIKKVIFQNNSVIIKTGDAVYCSWDIYKIYGINSFVIDLDQLLPDTNALTTTIRAWSNLKGVD